MLLLGYHHDFHHILGLVVVGFSYDVNCFSVRHILKAFSVHRQDLVTALNKNKATENKCYAAATVIG